MSMIIENPQQHAPAAPPPVAARGPRRITGRLVVNTVTVVVLLYLIVGPLFMLVLTAFEDTSAGVIIRPPIPWTGQNLIDLATNSRTYQVLGDTAIFTLGGLIIAFALSAALAWLIERTNLPGRNAIFVLIIAPQGIPVVISAIAWSLLLNPSNGAINLAFRHLTGGSTGPFNVYSMPWMIIIQGITMVPLTFLLLAPALRAMNTSFEEAGLASGASFATVTRKITLPLLKPAIIGALIYEFVNIVEVVDVPLILGIPGHINVLATEIYFSTHPATGLPNYGLGSAYGGLLLIIALLPLIWYRKMMSDESAYVTVTGKSYRPRRRQLGRWKWPAVIGVWLYIAVSLIVPLLILIWTSFQPYVTEINAAAFSRMTVKGYQSTLGASGFLSALKNTGILGFSAALMAMVLSALAAWIIVRSRSRLRSLVDVLAFLPHAMPGVVIGLAILIIYLVVPIPIYGTIWIVVVAVGTQYISLGTRLTVSGMSQIHRSLEEGAAASGANNWQTWRRVLLPLMRPALLSGFLLVFLSSIQNLTLPLVLYSPNNAVISTMIYFQWSVAGHPQQTAVLSVVMTAVTIVAALIVRKATGERM